MNFVDPLQLLLAIIVQFPYSVIGNQQYSYYATSAAGRPKNLIVQNQNTCNLVKGLHANLIRFITKEGFHRDVEDTLEITVTNSPIPMQHFTSGECNFAILAKFSQDVFVDPYEISRDLVLNGHIRVLNDWTDLENPAWLAESNSTVFIQLENVLTGNLISTVPVKLPIHYRYQKSRSHSRLKSRRQEHHSGMLNPGGYFPVTIPLPRILLRCEQWDLTLTDHNCPITKEICTSSSAKSSQCLWVDVPFKANTKSSTIMIPIGDTDMRYFITGATLLVVLAGTLFLLATLVQAKNRSLNSNTINQRPHVD